jgi:hypothetical protein
MKHDKLLLCTHSNKGIVGPITSVAAVTRKDTSGDVTRELYQEIYPVHKRY